MIDKGAKPMEVTEELIQRLAEMAKLEFNEEEKEEFTEQLKRIMGMIEELDELGKDEVEEIPAIYHGIALENVYREDIPEEGTKKEALLKNAPTSKEGLIQVPA